MMLAESIEVINKLENKIGEIVKGKSQTIKLILTALIADGHVLLEDYPGSGKTTLAKTLGNLIDIESEDLFPFKRVQFTPDLLPSDVLGVNIFEPKNGDFRFVKGPIFSHIILADEINRAGPKVQAAFLECMAEKQVTIENVTHKLDDLFFVIGTQNPLDIAGTYPLPIVQLDRFLFRLPMTYVEQSTEIEILKEESNIRHAAANIKPVVTRTDILKIREFSRSVKVEDRILNIITKITGLSRNNPSLQYGLSTRSAIMLLNAVKAFAVVSNRDYVTEDDLKTIAPYVLQHRLKFVGNGIQNQQFWDWFNPIIEELIRMK